MERGRVLRFCLRSAVAAFLVFAVAVTGLSIPLVSYELIDHLQVYPAITADALAAARQEPATAIAILSAGRRNYAPEFGGETLDELSLERARYGAEVARQTGLPVLVSGGLGTENQPPLAALMAATLSKDYGIEPKWQEAQSATTAENAMFSAKILHEAGIGRVILVTHAWHMKRARDAFAANGLTVIPAPTAFYGRARSSLWLELMPNVYALRMSGFAIHEYGGAIWYGLRYGY